MKLNLLIPVWGEKYIHFFADVGLRSLLCQRNIPLICKDFEVETVFLTTRDRVKTFESLPAVRLLKQYSAVSYIFIDDLVSKWNYGVTLTLAYARGILSTGEAQTSTAFIFFNSDFVVSDGSLETVARLITSGTRCVIAPSLRVNAEDVFPDLLHQQKRVGERAFHCRSMVDLALRNLHLTVQGRTLTQKLVSCSQYGQFYWRVDADTLIGAQHLIFHPAIWPEVPLKTVNSYHDYCFVPELVPSGRFHLIDDSDDFFMVEFQQNFRRRTC